MPASTSVQRAHDDLLGNMPPGATHERCDLCVPGSQTEQAKEEAVADGPSDKTFTLAEHEAILADATAREVAAATAERDAKIAELQSAVDVLEAEKASVVAEKETVEREFAEFQAAIETAAEVETRKAERLERVKAAAGHLPEEYFTPERQQRWAEMAAEAFDALVKDFEDAGLKELVTAGPGKVHVETAALGGGQTPTGKSPEASSSLGSYLGARRHGAPAPAEA